MKTQQQRVIEELEKGGITNIWAVQHFILRLGARIKDLRDAGWNIEGAYLKRGKNKTKVFKYTLV